jgi:hypothetical protein
MREAGSVATTEAGRPDRVRIGAYYFPSYQADPRNDEWHGRGWTEWELTRRAEPRFEGHTQPKIPSRGYVDDADPRQAADTIELARSHGLDFFLYSWHWFEDGPFLARALEEGFLEAPNAADLPIAISWANQDWDNLFPAKRHEGRTILAPGSVSHASFREATDRVIGYMRRPQYHRVAGGAYFNVFDPLELVAGLGGPEATAEALRDFRRRADEAGVGELHLCAGLWGMAGESPPHLRGWKPVAPDLVRDVGFDSTTSYNWFQYVPFGTELTVDYADVVPVAEEGWERFAADHVVPYIPTVMMGWDPSPRSVPSEEYVVSHYPYTNIVVGNSPESFGRTIDRAAAFAQRPGGLGQVIVYAWNEWTEGSFLDPEREHGDAYLAEIARATGSAARPQSPV